MGFPRWPTGQPGNPKFCEYSRCCDNPPLVSVPGSVRYIAQSRIIQGTENTRDTSSKKKNFYGNLDRGNIVIMTSNYCCLIASGRCGAVATSCCLIICSVVTCKLQLARVSLHDLSGQSFAEFCNYPLCSPLSLGEWVNSPPPTHQYSPSACLFPRSVSSNI